LSALPLNIQRQRYAKKAPQVSVDPGGEQELDIPPRACPASPHAAPVPPALPLLSCPSLQGRPRVPITPDHTTATLWVTLHPTWGTRCLFVFSGGSGEKVREAACQEYA